MAPTNRPFTIRSFSPEDEGDEFAIPEVPENLAELSDDDLATLAEQVAAAFEELREHPASPERTASMRAMVEATRSVREVQGERAAEDARLAEESAALEAEMEALSDQGEPDEPGAPAGDPPTEPTEPETTPTTAPTQPTVTASTRARVPVVPARVPANRQPRPRPTSRVSITAGADVPGYGIGQSLSGMDDIVAALVARAEQLGQANHGVDEKVVVATINVDIPEERTVSSFASDRANTRRVNEAIQRTNMRDIGALTAAGGLCAPVDSLYDQLAVGNTDEPIRASLPDFGADRGGIRFVASPALTNVAGAVGTMTAAADAAGGAGAVKTCLNVACDPIAEVLTISIYSCLEFNNWGALTFPERVEAQTQLALVQAARVSEQVRLDAIAAGSIATNRAGAFGSARQFIATLSAAAASIRSRNRLAPDFVIDLKAPSWVPALIAADFAAASSQSPFDGPTAAELVAELAGHNIRATWYLDSKTGGGQIFAAQGAGVLAPFPTNMLLYLHVPGTFVGLRGATLNLGLVRDSTLTMGSGTTPGNRFRVFTETWANVAKVSGIEALEISVPSCPSGTSGGSTVATCAAGVDGAQR